MDSNGFVEDQNPWIVIGIATSVFTGFLSFWLVYELFFEQKYWKNRWTLYRLLKKGKVTVEESEPLLIDPNIIEYSISIGDLKYSMWIYNNQNRFTFSPFGNVRHDTIGLFLASPILKWINHWTIRRIQELSTPEYSIKITK
jgi:hypothetical protein